jgi:hypothetical protein
VLVGQPQHLGQHRELATNGPVGGLFSLPLLHVRGRLGSADVHQAPAGEEGIKLRDPLLGFV